MTDTSMNAGSGEHVAPAQSQTTLVDLNLDGVIDDIEIAIQQHPMYGLVPEQTLRESVELARGLNIDGEVIQAEDV